MSQTTPTNVIPIRGRSSAALGDDALTAAAATGDPKAVGTLFVRFQPTVTRFLGRLLRGSDEVEDLTQATFLLIARGQCSFEGRSSGSTWLLGIAANVVRDHRRSTRRRLNLMEAVQSVVRSGRGLAAPDEIAGSREELSVVNRALRALPLEQRMAFVLCELEGLKAKEVADILDVAETAVWKRVSEARKSLRQAVVGSGS